MSSTEEAEAQQVSQELSKKLQSFYDALSEEEKLHMQALLAQAQGDEVSGFGSAGNASGHIRYPIPRTELGGTGPTHPDPESGPSSWGIVELRF